MEKKLRALRKKLGQIEQLKEKGGVTDAEVRQKIAAEPTVRADIAALEAELASLGGVVDARQPVSAAAKTPALSKVPAPAAATPAASEPSAPEQAHPPEVATKREDVHRKARADALEPPPEDLGLLLDDETERRFRALQKKLRDIGKLYDKDKLDKLQVDKLGAEPQLIDEIGSIRAKAAAILASRKAARSQVRAAPSGAPAPPTKEERDDDSDDSEEERAKVNSSKKHTYASNDLKTKRSQKAPAPVKRRYDDVVADPSKALWPEVKEVLESGEGGVDKSRQKQVLAVNHPRGEPPYGEFDTLVFKCSFVTRLELRLPNLMDETFQALFPGALAENLVELILKQNALTSVPLGLRDLSRLRSLDLSHNQLEFLPEPDVWDGIAGTLESLDLSFNRLESLDVLSPLTKLSALKVDNNQLTSLDGLSWDKLKQLVSLSAAGNQITMIPEEIAALATSLEHLELGGNKLQAIPAQICDLKKLKFLSIEDNPIKDAKIGKALEKGIKDLKAYLAKISGGKKK